MNNQGIESPDYQQPIAEERMPRYNQFQRDQRSPSSSDQSSRSSQSSSSLESLNESPPRKKKAEDPDVQLIDPPVRIQEDVTTNPMILSLIQKTKHLLDKASFAVLCSSDDSIIVGKGTINGRRVIVYSHRLVAPGHSMLKRQSEIIMRAMKYALSKKEPLIGIEDYSGVNDDEEKYTEFHDASKVLKTSHLKVPFIRLQINVDDVSIETTKEMIEADFLFVVGKSSYILSDKDNYDLAHRMFSHSLDAKTAIRTLINLMPSSSETYLPLHFDSWEPINSLNILKSNLDVCDIKCVVRGLADNGTFFEIKPKFGTDIVVGLLSIGSWIFGVIGNDPHSYQLMGKDTIRKGVEFLAFCRKFNIPLVSIIDTPSLMADDKNVKGLSNLSEAFKKINAPKFTVITRIGHEMEQDENVSQLFKSNKTYIWDNVESTEKTQQRLVNPKLSAPAQTMNAEIVVPKETGTKIVAVLAHLKKQEKEKKTTQSTM